MRMPTEWRLRYTTLDAANNQGNFKMNADRLKQANIVGLNFVVSRHHELCSLHITSTKDELQDLVATLSEILQDWDQEGR